MKIRKNYFKEPIYNENKTRQFETLDNIKPSQEQKATDILIMFQDDRNQKQQGHDASAI